MEQQQKFNTALYEDIQTQVTPMKESSLLYIVHVQSNDCSVIRSYSDFKQLYKNLLRYSDCSHRDRCTCGFDNGCPFWSLFMLLQTYQFPRTTLLPLLRRAEKLKTRQLQLGNFLRMILDKLQSFRQDIMLDQEFNHCLIVREIELFLGLRHDVITTFIKAKSPIPTAKHIHLSLSGWHTTRATSMSKTCTTTNEFN